MKQEDDEAIFMLTLITNVEEKPCLYDKKDPFYFNKDVKQRTWNEVGEVCGRRGGDCKHRWKLLRERFCKELKRMETPSGSGMINQEEWRFLQPMMFLKEYLAPRRYLQIFKGWSKYNNRDNIEKNCSEVHHDQSPFKNQHDQPSFNEESLLDPLLPAKKSKHNLDSLCQKFGETIEKIEKSIAEPVDQETADGMFMKTVLCLMKDLPIDIKEDFQAGVIQEVYRLRKSCRELK